MNRVTLQIIVLLLSFAIPQLAKAQDSRSLSQGQQKVALKFARQHHPELASLVLQLKEMDQEKYLSAVNEIHRTHERLEKIRSRSDERYEIDLELWKIDSRVRLLAARAAAGMEGETRQEIKTLLLKKNQIRLQLAQDEKKRLTSRLKKLEDQIKQYSEQSETIADQDLDRLMKSINRLSSRKQTATESRTVAPKAKEKEAPKNNRSKPTQPPKK